LSYFFIINITAIVSAKTRESREVFTLHLSREAPLKKPTAFIYLLFRTIYSYSYISAK
jgi:hypothetical protein